jgi:hypothetical protein
MHLGHDFQRVTVHEHPFATLCGSTLPDRLLTPQIWVALLRWIMGFEMGLVGGRLCLATHLVGGRLS